MFLEGGHAYIYLCYGIHHLFNVVTGPAGAAHAVLIRAVEPIHGLPLMQERRGRNTLVPASGPGACGAALGMHSRYSGADLCKPDAPVWLTQGTGLYPEEHIRESTRIGVDYARECALWPWRYYLYPNQHVSKVLRTDRPFEDH
jgi:DNA-3-methyladenine glycosylase